MTLVVPSLLERWARRRAGRLALVLSVGAHAVLLPACLLTPRERPYEAPRYPTLDTSSPEPHLQVTLADVDRLPPLTVVPSVASEPSPIVQPVPTPPVALPDPPAPFRLPGLLGPSGSEGGARAGPSSAAASLYPQPKLLRASGQAQSVVYVLDRSTSMGLSGAWDVARSEVVASLAHLPTTARFQVILYDVWAQPLLLDGSTGLLPAGEENARRVDQKLATINPGGGTKHKVALFSALELHPEVIFLVTDGDDLTLDEVRQVTLRNRGAAIHVVELTTSRQAHEAGPLQELAARNRGTYQLRNISPAVQVGVPLR